MLNINITLSVIFDGKKTDKELDSAIASLESTVDRLQVKYGQTVSTSVQSVSNELVVRNKAYLTANGRQRTPKVTERELTLREQHKDDFFVVNWQDLQERHNALMRIGHDIFAKSTSDDNNESGETFGESLDLSTVPADE